MMKARLKIIRKRGVLPWFLLAACTLIGGWAAAEARSAKARPVRLAQAMDTAARLPLLRSLLVSFDGKIVMERYFNGANPWERANLKSASKSILSALVGIALDRGHIESIREPIGKYFPEIPPGGDSPIKKTITIEDLLTMRSGLESTSRSHYGQWVQSSNWVRYVLTRPLVDIPGGRMIYSTGNSHLLSALLTRATRMSTFDFARRHLAEPLGINIHPWMRDPQGIYFGGNEMHLTPRAMLAFGRLYLNNGRAGHKTVVSEGWVRESFIPRTRSPRHGQQYGFGWWIRDLAGHPTSYAWGHGGQFIFVVPDLYLTVVATASGSDRRKRREHRRAIFDLMEQELIPATERQS